MFLKVSGHSEAHAALIPDVDLITLLAPHVLQAQTSGTKLCQFKQWGTPVIQPKKHTAPGFSRIGRDNAPSRSKGYSFWSARTTRRRHTHTPLCSMVQQHSQSSVVAGNQTHSHNHQSKPQNSHLGSQCTKHLQVPRYLYSGCTPLNKV